MCRCYIHLDNKLFNDHILIRVLLRPLKSIAKLLRGCAKNPWVRHKKVAEKRGRGAMSS
jgi:hypothetical protein